MTPKLTLLIIVAISTLLSSCIENFKPKKKSADQNLNEYSMPELVHVYDEYLKSAPLVKVLILKNANEFSLAINSPFEIFSFETQKNSFETNNLYKEQYNQNKNISNKDNTTTNRQLISKSQNLQKSIVRLSNSNFIIGTTMLRREALEINPKIDGSIIINDISYWGKIKILPQPNNTFLVIEETDVDSYLSGVLGKEMPTSWTKNTLFAQAVTARTYALYQMKKHILDDYHLKKIDLAYGGRSSETEKTNEIINKSKGIIMVHNWLLFPAYFHSTCGGHTEDVNHVFNEKSIPPLSGTTCGYCEASKYYRWQANFTKNEIASKLKNYNIKANGSFTITPVGLGKGGHATTIKVSSSSDIKDINANKFRLLIGPNKLFSTSFTVKDNDTMLNFNGRGWGHGLGLCQYGAQKMGLTGVKWYDIVKHYYPGVDLVKVY